MIYKIAAAALIATLCFIAFTNLAPASIWLEVKDVYVFDSVVGQTPEMRVDRKINQNFRGSYVIDIERLNENGSYTPVCMAYASTNYNTEAQLPDPVTLDWWTFPTECNLPVGTYRMETSWNIKTDWFPDKLVYNTSNVFNILEESTLTANPAR